jgi:uncharacterized protein YjbI with pentapeptide repeats
LASSNFDDTVINNLHFFKSNLVDCDFQNAKISKITIEKSNLSGSLFNMDEKIYYKNTKFFKDVSEGGGIIT